MRNPNIRTDRSSKLSMEGDMSPENSTQSLTIDIVGGSISGYTAAIELTLAGHQVEVFEHSRGESRGGLAGIGTLESSHYQPAIGAAC